MTNKSAETLYPIHEFLRERWSPRAFADRPVSTEQLITLLEAARWSPSAFNEQPWSFIVAMREDQVAFERILGCLMEGNIVWAQHAPVLMIAVAKQAFAHNEKPNRHAFHDVGQAIAHLTFQAAAEGLVLHQMAGFSPDKAREVFAIPETHAPATAIAIGYVGQPDALPDTLRERELADRSRNPLASFVFTEGWDVPSSYLQTNDTNQ
ncbi:MAG: nitroreductase [Chloroflexi bacterium AL-W]|nr:nitroreductase [Chloroflexi bacterium AL-N1]NOK64501.1 nitroreductase [Chloroflexi bacterium AL-N10]NOK75743.1 nitroreductase [Chloroflexi bacterium AL-N5]NOK80498.1 nitroreductase [Chloroflexi bacterium AL-W]NOK87012.1 nitroreductase [Chloroflexi bacterium AL-N15]